MSRNVIFFLKCRKRKENMLFRNLGKLLDIIEALSEKQASETYV